MKLCDSKNLALVLMATVAVSACGPVASSVSKMGGGGGGKSDSPTQNLNSTNDPSEASREVTLVVKEDEFKCKWPAITAANKQTMLIVNPDLYAVKTSFLANSAAVLDSSDNKYISDSEGTLSSGANARIQYFLVVNSETELSKIGIDAKTLISASIVWKEKEEGKGHWELSLTEPKITGDDVANDPRNENIRKALVQQLVGVGVVFGADLKTYSLQENNLCAK